LIALKELDLLKCANLKELPSSISQLDAFEKACFVRMCQLETTTFIYRPIECPLKA